MDEASAESHLPLSRVAKTIHQIGVPMAEAGSFELNHYLIAKKKTYHNDVFSSERLSEIGSTTVASDISTEAVGFVRRRQRIVSAISQN